MPPPFTSIFTAVVFLNAAVTFRSSKYWKKCTQSGSRNNESDDRLGLVEEGSRDQDHNDTQDQESKHFKLLQKYLVVYVLSALSDWLQGPYVYALYAKYGYSQHVIAILFVAGFGSSMIFGSFIGDFADKYGRKRYTLVYVLSYIGSCLTKHFRDFNMLLLGRILGGISTSLLFSVFDSWLIRAHADAHLSAFLPSSFAAASYGNSIVAILAGLIANKVASSNDMVPIFSDNKTSTSSEESILYKGGYLNPFDVAILALVIAGTLCTFLWNENYGSTKGHADSTAESDEEEIQTGDSKRSLHWYDGFKTSFYTTIRSADILQAGIICSLFEGSMYIFVFMWTPAMTNLTSTELPKASNFVLPFGLIFSTFMVCCMAGSSLFSILIERFKVEALGVYVMGIASLSFAMMTLSGSSTITFLSFNVFEICVGMYFPIMGTMKSSIVPEDKRTAIYNLYRIPLNFIVVSSLLTDLTPSQSFFLCTCMLLVATVLQRKLSSRRMTKGQQVASSSENDLKMTLSRSGSLKLKNSSESSDDFENIPSDSNNKEN